MRQIVLPITLVLGIGLAIPAAAQQDILADPVQRSTLILQMFQPIEILGAEEYFRLLNLREPDQESNANQTSPSRVVQQARDLLRIGQDEAAITLLEGTYRSGDKTPDVAHMLALLSAEDTNPGRRRKALDLINAALRADPRNPDYRLARAEIYRALSLEENAIKEVDRLISDDPRRAEAYAVRGQIIIEDLTLFGRHWGEVFVGDAAGDQVDAERLLATALTLDDRNARALRWLAHLYLYQGAWSRAMAVLNRMVRDGIELGLARLGQGMVFYYFRLFDDARTSWEAAQRDLGPDVGYLVQDPGWARPIQTMGLPEPSTLDSTEVAIFWASKDLLLSDHDEMRSLEQMRRFAMVAWFFDIPRLGLKGWETIKGQIYLRYGTPPVWTAASSEKEQPWWGTRGKFDIANTGLPAGEPGGRGSVVKIDDVLPTFPEEWMRYPGFSIPLGMGFITGRQGFVTQNRSGISTIDRTELYIEHTRRVPELSSVRGLEAPTRLPVATYRFPGPAGEWEVIPLTIADDSLTRSLLEGQGLGPSPKLFTCTLETATGTKQVLPSEVFAAGTRWSSLPYSEGRLVIGGPPARLRPGNHLISLELVGEYNRAWVARDSLTIPTSNGGLVLSDLVLAETIKAQDERASWPSAAVIRRSGLLIAPRTDNAFLLGDPMYLYLEIAGLAKDDMGATDYTVALSVTEEKGGGLVEVIADLLRSVTGRTQEQGTVTTSWRRSGITTQVAESLRVVIPEATLGDYRISLTVTDHVADTSAKMPISLHLVDRLPTPK